MAVHTWGNPQLATMELILSKCTEAASKVTESAIMLALKCVAGSDSEGSGSEAGMFTSLYMT